MSESLDRLAEDLGVLLTDLPSFGEMIQIADAVSGGKSPFGWDCWHPEQQKFEIDRCGYDFVLKSRQMGFSTVELARDLQFAMTNESVQVLIVTHDRKEKGRFFSRLKMMAQCLSDWGLIPEAKYSTQTDLYWEENDSGVFVIESGASERAAKKTGRSGTIHRLHATEVAFWGSPEETWTALEGAMEHGTEAVIESTANGADTWFHEKWLKVSEGTFGRWKSHFYPWFDHPGREADPDVFNTRGATRRERRWEDRLIEELLITPEQLAWWRMKVETVGLDKMLREYPPTPESAFQSTGTTWIEAEWLDELDGKVRKPIRTMTVGRSELRVYREPQRNQNYILAADPSGGVGKDAAAMTIIDHRSGETVAVWHDSWTKPKPFARNIAEVGHLYNYALAAPEIEGSRAAGREAIGLVVVKELLSLGYRNIYKRRESKNKLGWSTNAKTRPVMLQDLADMIESGTMSTPDRRTVKETRAMCVDVDGKVRARGKDSVKGADDGLFITWAIAQQVRQSARIRRTPRIEPVGETVSSGFRT